MQLLDYDTLKVKGIKYSKPQLWRLVKAKKFPRPIKIGGARYAWIEAELDEWIRARIAERDEADSNRTVA